MVGGGNSRRDDGSMGMNRNVFAALESLRRKKKSEKSDSLKKSKGSSKDSEEQARVFWAPAPLTVKSWADADDDEDDYYATTAPPQSVWGSDPNAQKEIPEKLEESESEEDVLDEGDDDVDDDHDHELEAEAEAEAEADSEAVASEPVAKKSVPVALVSKEPERQLSKKELKKKGLEELDAILAELGLGQKETNGQDESEECLSCLA
ncbi:hypothetical protein AMTR_s00142p00083960 [Amborella trichopoda]|uniref:Uncharacterized protein n=1 Tax=Amborella trichopoda TaxID=13333 RepID=W1PG46_AMBTC|nr:hypothetical protein AMTR_s00142p00083960 [Amborella trichopoda]